MVASAAPWLNVVTLGAWGTRASASGRAGFSLIRLVSNSSHTRTHTRKHAPPSHNLSKQTTPTVFAHAQPVAHAQSSHRGALGRCQRLVNRAVGHDHVDQQEPAQVELGRERERAVAQLGAPVVARW